MTGGFWSRSTLVHARKRDGNGHIVGHPLCGARTTRTDDDAKVTCTNCRRLLEKLRSAKATDTKNDAR